MVKFFVDYLGRLNSGFRKHANLHRNDAQWQNRWL